MVSLRGADPEFAEWLSGAMKEYDSLSGWCNAPKHICAGGDLRGLAFCCPPVKHCAVLGALKRAGMTPEEFVEKKISFARGTPLEKGRWHLLWKSGVVLQDQQALLPARRSIIQNRALRKRVHGTEKEAGRRPASQILLIEIGMNEPRPHGPVRRAGHALRAFLQSQARQRRPLPRFFRHRLSSLPGKRRLLLSRLQKSGPGPGQSGLANSGGSAGLERLEPEQQYPLRLSGAHDSNCPGCEHCQARRSGRRAGRSPGERPPSRMPSTFTGPSNWPEPESTEVEEFSLMDKALKTPSARAKRRCRSS